MFRKILLAILLALGLFTTNNAVMGQASTRIYRIAKITIDSNHVANYRLALEEQMQAAIQKEPGVLSYTALANKNDPTQITIIEVYASKEAYERHTETTHFKKYKQTVRSWVLSLELIDQELLAAAQQKS